MVLYSGGSGDKRGNNKKSRDTAATASNPPREHDDSTPYLDSTYSPIRIDAKSQINFGSHLISIAPQKNRNESVYRRFEASKMAVEQLLSVSNDDYTISIIPIPPVNTPSKISDHVMIKFKMPIVIDAEGHLTKYCTMPIELATIRMNKDSSHLPGIIDTFSVASTKYALYGEPHNGLITRFHQASLHDTLDEVDAKEFQEAKLEIALNNNTDTAIKVNRIVLPAAQMNFFYDTNDQSITGNDNNNHHTVYLEAIEMDIQSNMRAMISLLNRPPREPATPVPSISNLSERERFEMKRGVLIA